MRRLLFLVFLGQAMLLAQSNLRNKGPRDAIDRDLMDTTVERLHALYREHRYTVSQVVQWQDARLLTEMTQVRLLPWELMHLDASFESHARARAGLVAAF